MHPKAEFQTHNITQQIPPTSRVQCHHITRSSHRVRIKRFNQTPCRIRLQATSRDQRTAITMDNGKIKLFRSICIMMAIKIDMLYMQVKAIK